MTEVKKIFISWDKFHQDTLKICEQIKNPQNIVGIVTITRGGLVPSCIIANALNVRNLEILALHSYDKDSMENSDIKVLSYPTKALDVKGQGWIVVDELADSGNSIAYAKELLPKAVFYTVYSKMENNDMLGCDPIIFNKEDWICFPWE